MHSHSGRFGQRKAPRSGIQELNTPCPDTRKRLMIFDPKPRTYIRSASRQPTRSGLSTRHRDIRPTHSPGDRLPEPTSGQRPRRDRCHSARRTMRSSSARLASRSCGRGYAAGTCVFVVEPFHFRRKAQQYEASLIHYRRCGEFVVRRRTRRRPIDGRYSAGRCALRRHDMCEQHLRAANRQWDGGMRDRDLIAGQCTARAAHHPSAQRDVSRRNRATGPQFLSRPYLHVRVSENRPGRSVVRPMG